MAGESTSKRCKAKTKAGKPCRAWALQGHLVCLSHADAKTRESVGFTAAAGKLGGRPRKAGREQGASNLAHAGEARRAKVGLPRRQVPTTVGTEVNTARSVSVATPRWLGRILREADAW